MSPSSTRHSASPRTQPPPAAQGRGTMPDDPVGHIRNAQAGSGPDDLSGSVPARAVCVRIRPCCSCRARSKALVVLLVSRLPAPAERVGAHPVTYSVSGLARRRRRPAARWPCNA